MTQTKVFQKILSVTLIGAFIVQQTGFVWAADVDTWEGLKTGIQILPGEYNVTTDLTADSTISVTENNTIMGAKLSKGSATTLFNNSATLNLGNNISGSIVNNGTLNYSGNSLADGSVTGAGTLAFLGTAVTNANTITQNAVSVAGTSTLTNNQTITASTFANNGTVDNNAKITAAITNAGTLSSTADNLNGTVTNTNMLTLEGGEVKGAISGATGTTNITGNLTNEYAITQAAVSNSATLTNSGVITAAISNTGTGTIDSTATNLKGAIDNDGTLNLDGGTVQGDISSTNGTGITNISADLINNYTITQASVTNTANMTGTGKLNVTGDSTNNGSITQNLVAISNNATFNNNGMLLAKASNAAGSTLNSDPDNLGDDVANDGTLNLNDRGTLSVAVTGDGETNIQKDLDNQGSISQKTINIQSGAVVTSNASDMTASDTTTGIANAGTIKYTGGSTANKITGDGRIDITGYVTNTGDITQKTVGNSGVFTNNGTVTANLTNTNAIEGTGSITTGTGVSSNTGTIEQASLTNAGTFDNSGHITLTDVLTNNTNATFNTNADLIAATNGISNAGNLNITGGTNTNVITGDAGTTNFSNTVTNNATITQGTVTNSGTLTNNAVITAAVTNTGTLTSNGENIVGAIANTGTYVISGGNNANAIIGEGGKLSILGDTTNTGAIKQETLAIANSGSFTTDSDLVIASITNDGKLEWTDGSTANENVISGVGQLNITGGDIVNSASIGQNEIRITGSGSLTSNADLLASANGITNNVDGGLTLTGGTNANAIDGTGSMAVTGDVTNQAAIGQDSITVSSGKLTTAADLLTTGNGITNNSEISFTSGDNNNAITGTGTTFIDGTVQNLAEIHTDVQVNTGAHYGTATDVYAKLENRGTTDLIDADIDSNGKISGTGVTNILGETTNNSSISQSAVNIAAGGSLTSNSDHVEAAIINDGTYNINAGTGNSNVIGGNGTLNVTGGTISNSAAIIQNQINITGGTLTSNADLLVSAGGINNEAALSLTGGTNTNVITGTNGALTTTGDVINNASITQNSVTVDSGSLGNAGTITANVTVNSGAVLASDADDIDGDIHNQGTYAITDGDNDNDIDGTGDLQVLGNTTNTGTIAQGTISINTGATFVASNMGNVTTTTGIDNAGTFEMQAGNNTNDITGNTGALKVTGVVTNASGASISQDTIDIATLGDFTADAGDLVTVDGITNAGSLTLGDGSTANNISGNGTLAVTGTVTNTGNINQKSLANTGTLTSDASLLAFADGITNSNILNLTGGTNANTIMDAAGTTNFTNDVVNNAAIEQAAVTNDTGTLTNNAAITAAFTNNGGTVNNEAAITGAITNTGTINSTADNLAGAIDSDGTLNIAGGTVQDAISGAGIMNITDDLVNNYTIAQATVNNSANMTNSGAITADFTNSGVVDNSADITGAITNAGTINSTATNLKGTIDNDGTLNLAGGTVQDDISSTNGTGITNITADLTNDFTIAQATVNNSAALTNNAAISATTVTNDGTVTNGGTITATDIVNNGTITGAADALIASNEIANEGTLVFNVADATGASNISGNGDVQVTANTELTGNNSYTGGTLIDRATLTVAGQNNLGTGDVLFANDTTKSGILQVTDAGSLSNNLLGQSATEKVSVQNDDALTLNGNIGAATDFHKLGAGTMTLAMASNTYTGDTYVDAGTLIGNTLNINNVVNGAAGTTVEFNDTTDAELNEINTLGTFVQSGSAVLNVQNNAFSAAQAELNNGTFAANRALNADVLNVNNGATLRGNGNITGTVNVNNGGTIAPGNSIDTLTIMGDVNFNNGSTTAIEINETPASDKIVISGNAEIANGANLTVSNENGRYFEWKEFEIINAGNVNGEFTYDGSIADYDASRIDVELDYSDPTKVLLTAKRKSTNHTAVDGLSRNQGHVAKAMDAVSTGFGGDITNALLQLEKLGGLNPADVNLINENSTFKSALNDLGGVLYANSALATLFNAKTAHVYDRISKRNPAAGKCPTCHDNVWAEYYGQYDKVYADANSPRFTNNMTGVLVGYDRSSDEALLGVYGGAGKSDLRQRHDTMDIDDVSLGIYAGYRPGNWIFKGTLFGGYQNYHGKRSIDFMARSAEGKYHGFNVALDLEGGYNVELYDWLNLKPFVGVLGNYAHMESFTETGAGALNLHVESKNQFNTQARLGVQLDGKVGKKFNWYGSAAVKQFIGGDYAKLHMSLGLPGTRMEIISAELGRTYFSGQVGVSYALTNHWSLFGNLEAGVNNKSANCYGNIGLAYTW